MNLFGFEVSAGLFWAVTTGLLVVALVLLFLGGRGLLRRRRGASVKQLADVVGDLRFDAAVLAGANRALARASGPGLKALARAQWTDAVTRFREAFERCHGDAERAALRNLVGIGLYLGGRLDAAADSFEESARLAGSGPGQAAALSNLGMVQLTRGEMDPALATHQRVLELDREAGLRDRVAADLGRLGLVFQARHEPDRALELHQQALDLHREMGDRRGEANELGRIGLVHQVRGDADTARRLYEQGLKAAQAAGYVQGAGELLGNLGLLLLAEDEPEAALDRLLRALGLFMRARAEGRMLNVVNSLFDVRARLGPDRFRELCGKAGLAGPEFDRLDRLLDEVRSRRPVAS